MGPAPAYPEVLAIPPVAGPISGTVRVPGSKSLTNRALILGAACGVHSWYLTGALRSEDTEVMVQALQRLGYEIVTDWNAERPEIRMYHPERGITANEADLFVANSGTSMRFLTALVCLGHGRYRLVAPCAGSDVTIEVTGALVSEPYVDMTVELLRRYGYVVESGPGPRYRIPAQRRSSVCAGCAIEPDASAASYFFAVAAITGGTIAVPGLDRKSLQGDVGFVDLLERMGCAVSWADAALTVRGGPLRGIDCDMNAISDTVMTLGAVACFAEGPTTIRNVAHIRHKETDRLAALATELRRVGAEVHERDDGLTIVPKPLHGAEIETYNDHRMAMSLAVVGLRVPGVVIRNPGCVAKTYPHFFTDLQQLCSRGAS
jgi:3-phosphoshikimate 1-carboxyvinyltransferase